MKVLAIVQARCSSSRLPGKVLKKLAGKPMIIHELERLGHSRLIDRIVLATSTEASDDPLEEVAAKSGVEIFRGSLDDVLDRYYQCAKKYQPEHVVRITGDCPIIDWRIVDHVIAKHMEKQNDYTATSEDFPDGLDTEVIRFSALEYTWKMAKMMSEREHVTLYLRNHSEMFQMEIIPCEKKLNNMRWTVDEPQDFTFIEKVFSGIYEKKHDFSMEDVLNFLEENEEVLTINCGIKRNEGLTKSLANDKEIKL